MMSKIKRSFVRKIRRKKKDIDWSTDFHLNISSKAMFKLSEPALKLYLVIILHGQNRFISTKTLAYRMGKSERSIQRYRDELKEKGFLRVVMIEPKKFQYIFDYKGALNELTKPKPKEEEKIVYIEKEVEETEEVIEEEIIEEEETEEDFLFNKTKEINDYSDFAILENKFWSLDEKTKKGIVRILKERKEKEPQTNEVIDWFLDKVSIV